MGKGLKWAISLIAAIVAVTAAVIAVIAFQEELSSSFGRLKRACCNAIPFRKRATEDEYADFADVE